MKINGYHSIHKYQSYQNQMGRQGGPVKKSSKQDQVEISSQAKQLQNASGIEAERKEKIAKIKAAIDNGTYKVNPEEVAKKLYDFWNR
ncbi:flagellar biosynthesis anti-sigma factor FlgM [Scopulibacillus cellulosilyticus]|uniref:Negative regulator of flagellin synthesis n=1 Tax=Scopulibacillus cellulosilyticus TaxID=2665665 RepID=A0ABW2PWS0_9BACL